MTYTSQKKIYFKKEKKVEKVYAYFIFAAHT
jgi:hypothetical protein